MSEEAAASHDFDHNIIVIRVPNRKDRGPKVQQLFTKVLFFCLQASEFHQTIPCVHALSKKKKYGRHISTRLGMHDAAHGQGVIVLQMAEESSSSKASWEPLLAELAALGTEVQLVSFAHNHHHHHHHHCI